MSLTTMLIIGFVMAGIASLPKEYVQKADEETTSYLAEREPRAYHFAILIILIIYITTLFT